MHTRRLTQRLGICRGALVLSIAAAVALTVAACHHKPHPGPGPGPGPCAPPTIDPERSLVIHDPAALANAFPLQKTLQKIIDTSQATTPTTPKDLLQTMLDSFKVPTFVQPVSGRTLPIDVRVQEPLLSATDLLNPSSPIGMVPLGLFNRFDLAPADASNCGEYRIVYAKKSTSPTNRFLVIFEAKLPNPTPGAIAGCKPVVDFWANLPTDPVQRVTKLESFYYQGLPGFGPVVTHANYGIPFGQVRSNLFVSEPTFQPWLLREHRTDLAGGVPVFRIDTVKENPLAEFYRAGALPGNTTAADRAAFRTHVLGQPVCNLVRPELKIPGATPAQIVNGIGAGFDPAFNEFQSVSLGDSDNPASNPDPAFVADLTTKLGALGTSTVNATQLLNRAGAMTCGGCHQFSATKDIGSGTQWPASAGFVHIAENGGLSPALNNFFLPERARILSRFVCDPTLEPQPQASCAPSGGGGPHPAVARHPAAVPTPNATLAAASGLQPQAIARLTEGRVSATRKEIDTARLAVLAAARRAAAQPPHAAVAARRAITDAEKTLRALVERAREQERAQPGAFVAVRRTH